MSRPSTYAQLLAAQREISRLKAEMNAMKGFTIQQCIDIAEISLNNAFQFGPVRVREFEETFRETFLTYANMCIADAGDDAEIVYTKYKLDSALRRARGEDTPEFESRYDPDYFYRPDGGFGQDPEQNAPGVDAGGSEGA